MATEIKKIISRRDTAANWKSNNPVLASGEIGVDTTNKEMKIGDGTTPWNTLKSELKKSSEQAANIVGNVVVGTSAPDKAIDLSSVSEKAGSLGRGGWYIDSSVGASHKVIEVSEEYGKITLTASSASYIGFLTEYTTPSNGAAVPYVNGTSRVTVYPGTNTIDIPVGTNYIVFTTVDGGGVRISFSDVKLTSREGLYAKLQDASSKSNDAYNLLVGTSAPDEAIDLSAVPQKNGSLGSGGWYISSSAGSAHKVIEVGEEYGKITLTASSASYIGFLTEYTTPSNGAAVPYVNGTSRVTVYKGKNELDIPVGTNYIVFTVVDGAGISISFSGITLSSREGLSPKFSALDKDLKDKQSWNFSTSSVLSVMSYNVGGWYNGSGPSVPDDKEDTYLPLNESILHRYSPDVMMLQEFHDYVVGRNRDYTHILGGYHVYRAKGDTDYAGKAIASRYAMASVENIAYKSDPERNYTKGYLYVNGRRVLFINTHLALTAQAASAQIDELLALVADEEYVVIGMDSNLNVGNSSDKAIMDKFSSVGMRYLNTDKVTYPRESEVIDNIIVTSNITLKSLLVDTQKEALGDDADHYPIIAYLEIF